MAYPLRFLTPERKKAQGFGAALDGVRRRTAKGWMTLTIAKDIT
ncbi:hypothetical protein [Burkholderia pseudomallei]|nr:hypothetical protein [Burkholderia pseudomallei]